MELEIRERLKMFKKLILVAMLFAFVAVVALGFSMLLKTDSSEETEKQRTFHQLKQHLQELHTIHTTQNQNLRVNKENDERLGKIETHLKDMNISHLEKKLNRVNFTHIENQLKKFGTQFGEMKKNLLNANILTEKFKEISNGQISKILEKLKGLRVPNQLNIDTKHIQEKLNSFKSSALDDLISKSKLPEAQEKLKQLQPLLKMNLGN